MDPTDALTAEELRESLERAREAERRERKLQEITRRMRDVEDSLPGLTQVALDSLLEYLEFERGFLLVAGAYDPGSTAGGESRPFNILAARSSKRHGKPPEGLDFEDVANPEFAINRSAAKRAFQSFDVLSIPDCLIQPQSVGEEVLRSVLCLPFSASPHAPAVIYLDRPLGQGPASESCLSLLSDYAERCVPILAQALLREEVLSLRSRLATFRETPPELGEEEATGEQILELPKEIPDFYGIVGNSMKMRRIFEIIEKTKDTDLNICIFGESGTGKELVARAIHNSSRRRDMNFITENCGTIAETLLESELFGHLKGSFTGADEDRQGLFQASNGGTIFLDEIGDMSDGMQRKLLRVLQEGLIRPIGSKQPFKVDVRVICASNKNLRTLVQKGSFRIDLFYRVNVISVDVPPLRDRMDDIPLLVAHFAREVQRDEGISRRIGESAMNAFLQYNWPGNVRELKNVIRRAMITCSHRTIVRKDVIPLMAGGQSAEYLGADLDRNEHQIVLRLPRRETFNEIIDECERIVLHNALKECHWNKSKVVNLLKIPRQSLYNKIEKHNLKRKWE